MHMGRTLAAALAMGGLTLTLAACGSTANTQTEQASTQEQATNEQSAVVEPSSSDNATASADEAKEESTAQPSEAEAVETNSSSSEASSTSTELSLPLDAKGAKDLVFSISPVRSRDAYEIKVAHKGQQHKAFVVTFGSQYGNFSYTVDAETGEIVERDEPVTSADIEN